MLTVRVCGRALGNVDVPSMTRKSYEPYCAKFDGPLKRRDRIKNLPVDEAVHAIRDALVAPKSSLVASTVAPSVERTSMTVSPPFWRFSVSSR